MLKGVSLQKLILVFFLAVPLSAVTVNPVKCPTNKIAPRRTIKMSWDAEYQPRTFGAFYDLLTPGNGYGNQPYDPYLQEEPQKDDPEDCGDIEDYDENDLSSLTPQYQRKQGGNGKFFFGLFNDFNPQKPQYPSRPPQPPHEQVPIKHPQDNVSPYIPYGTGGVFGNNPYRPPIHHHPSDNIKPVHDGNAEPQTTYRPYQVGGPSGHIVGVNAVTVTPRPMKQRPDPRPRPTYTPNYSAYQPRPTTSPENTNTRRPRNQSYNNNESILGSFFDLLF